MKLTTYEIDPSHEIVVGATPFKWHAKRRARAVQAKLDQGKVSI